MFSEYMLEHMATGFARNQLQITSTCNAKCIFCSNEQNPFKIKRLPFRSLDEIKRSFWYSEHANAQDLILNESLPGRISEGEALIHPDFIEILKFIRSTNKKATIKITTNASLLTSSLINEITDLGPFLFTISFHTMDKNKYNQILGLPVSLFDVSKNSFALLKEKNIGILPSLVALPSLVGYQDMEETIAFFKEYSNNILMWSPGYTKFTKEEIKSKMEFDKNELEDFIEKMSKKYKVHIRWSLSKHNIRSYAADIENHFHNSLQTEKRAVFFSSKAFSENITKEVSVIGKKYPMVEHSVFTVENETFGGNIEVAGLLTISDIEKTMAKCSKRDRIMLPGNFLDKMGFDLMKDSIIDFMERYKENTFVVV